MGVVVPPYRSKWNNFTGRTAKSCDIVAYSVVNKLSLGSWPLSYQKFMVFISTSYYSTCVGNCNILLREHKSQSNLVAVYVMVDLRQCYFLRHDNTKLESLR